MYKKGVLEEGKGDIYHLYQRCLEKNFCEETNFIKSKNFQKILNNKETQVWWKNLFLKFPFRKQRHEKKTFLEKCISS